MPEIKTLQDFYDPTRTMAMGMQYMQGQQHLALQAQQLGLQQQSIENQNKNMRIDNLQKALSVAPPMQSYPIYKQYMEELGQEPLAPNDYYANAPQARALRGAQSLVNRAIKTGGPEESADIGSLMMSSPAVANQITDKVAQTDVQQQVSARMKMANQEHNALVTRIKPEADVLNTLSVVTARGLENAGPIVSQMQGIEQKYQKDLKRLGIAGARKAREEAIAANPELAKFTTNSKQAVQTLQTGLDTLHQQEDALTTKLGAINLGTAQLGEGETVEKLQGDLAAIGHQIDFTKAHLAMAKQPTPQNLQAVSALKEKFDNRILDLSGKAKASSDSLAVRQGALNETIEQHRIQNERYTNIRKAQTDWQKAGGKLEDAWKYAEKYNVHVDEVKKAAEDPTKKGQMTVQFGSPAERNKIAEEQTMVSQIRRLKEDFKPEYTGWLDEKIGRAGQVTGTISKEREQWLARMRVLMSNLRSDKYGAALTQNETKTAIAELPNEKMKENQWMAAADAWEENWAAKIDNRMKLIERNQKAKTVQSRFEELSQQGLSKEQVFQKMIEEGH